MTKRIIILSTTLFLIVGVSIYCYFNYQFWNHYDTINFKTLKEFKGKKIKGFRGNQIIIHKDFEMYLKKIDKYATKNNLTIIVNESYRPLTSRIIKKVVKSSNVSNHLIGFAIDFNIEYDSRKYFSKDLKKDNLKNLPNKIQDFIKSIRKDEDLRWGGDFNKQDPVHIDYPLNIKNKSTWNKEKQNCVSDCKNTKLIWKFWR